MKSTNTKEKITNNTLYKAAMYDAGIEYLKITKLISQEKAKRIRKTLLTKEPFMQKVARFQKDIKDLKEAEKIFVRLISFLNKAAKYQGYKNFAEKIAANAKIPRRVFKNILPDSKIIINFLNKKVEFKKDIPKEYWTEHYLQSPKHFTLTKYKIPEEIYLLLEKYDPDLEKLTKKIKVKEITNDDNAFCKYNKNKDICEIFCPKGTKTLPSVFTFLHELGHARHNLTLKEKEKSVYKKEKYAHKFSINLAKKIFPEDEYWAYIWLRAKDLIVNGVFEYTIYSKQSSRPSKTYAELNNLFLNKKDQKENYYYLTDKNLIHHNGQYLTSAAAFMQSLKEIYLGKS